MRFPIRRDTTDAPTRAVGTRRRVADLYAVLALLTVAMLAVKTDRLQSRLAKLAVTGHAVAAEQSVPNQRAADICAGRDIKLVVAIEDAGEAQSVSAERLGQAFAALLEARGLCRAGRLDEALAAYDSITIGPVQATAK
jgi:hypothetical protein